jgi:hypothetical protein
MIAAGYVSKVASPYCSDPCFKEWIAQKKANFEYLQAMELEDQDTGERTSLLDKVMGSTSNPKNARAELMVRMRGLRIWQRNGPGRHVLHANRAVSLSLYARKIGQAQ